MTTTAEYLRAVEVNRYEYKESVKFRQRKNQLYLK